jgi:hypothetical protein
VDGLDRGTEKLGHLFLRLVKLFPESAERFGFHGFLFPMVTS